nr:MAG TPA: hypothetical protein [Caudoviricetes sp.]
MALCASEYTLADSVTANRLAYPYETSNSFLRLLIRTFVPLSLKTVSATPFLTMSLNSFCLFQILDDHDAAYNIDRATNIVL